MKTNKIDKIVENVTKQVNNKLVEYTLGRGDNDFINDLEPNKAGMGGKNDRKNKAKHEFVDFAKAFKTFYVNFFTNMGYSLGYDYDENGRQIIDPLYEPLKQPTAAMNQAISQVYQAIHKQHYNESKQKDFNSIVENITKRVLKEFDYDIPNEGEDYDIPSDDEIREVILNNIKESLNDISRDIINLRNQKIPLNQRESQEINKLESIIRSFQYNMNKSY